MSRQPTVAEFVVEQLAAHGVREVFGVAGDYSFALCDAVCQSPSLRWIGGASELTSGYMADGAARVRGISALCTTFGVGELSALNAVAGACAERVPVIHIVGLPPENLQKSGAILHHSLGDGRFGLWSDMARQVACASGIVTAENARTLVPRVLEQAQWHSRPAYLGIAADVAMRPVKDADAPLPTAPRSDPEALAAATEAVLERMDRAESACAFVSALAVRLGLRAPTLRLLERAGLPFAAMWMDKSALDESHPLYCGMYSGSLTNEPLREFVETCDLIVNLGALESDLNLGAYTARLDRRKSVAIGSSTVVVGSATYHDVQMGDMVRNLADRVVRRAYALPPAPRVSAAELGDGTGIITAEILLAHIQRFLQPDDMVFLETGTISMGVMPLRMPARAECHSQALWGSIGWGLPAAVGGALAAPDRRCVVLTGEGSLQMGGAAEIGCAARYGAQPIVIVVNNGGYLTERLLCRYPDADYNDIPAWNYSRLPEVFGAGNWWTRRVETCEELGPALASLQSGGGPALLEIITPKMSMPEIGTVLRRKLDSLYQRTTN